VKPLFSVVVIARNEERHLPKLLESLKEFQEQGGEVIVVDTGSMDNTELIAKVAGCRVKSVGHRFIKKISNELVGLINNLFVVQGELPVVYQGDEYFDFSEARNYAASLASNDMIVMPDCDEMFTSLDIEGINSRIQSGVGQLQYNFVYSHDERGEENCKFMASKFYDRRKIKWIRIVHEVLQGVATTEFVPENILKLEHWQNPISNRGSYLKALAVDSYLHLKEDRQSHYFAREMMYNGRPKSALKEFDRHMAMGGWPAERAQSAIFSGDCLMALGETTKGLQMYHAAILIDGSRREAWLRLATHFFLKKDHHRTAAYAMASLALPWVSYYGNTMADYTYRPHELLYWALWYLGEKEEAAKHWKKALTYKPGDQRYIQDSIFFCDILKCPSVAIIIPTLGREEKLQKLLKLIPERASYSNYKVIVQRDEFPPNNQGVTKTFKNGLEESQSDLVMYLGNDCVPEQDFLFSAVWKFQESFPDGIGLVGLNDGHWKGQIATHWLASRNLLPLLGGEFFHTGYHHVGCDNELTARCKKLGKYVWCEESRVWHPHPKHGDGKDDEVYQLGWQDDFVRQDRALLDERSKLFDFEVI
jgi:glycosyltransferase involved in cell wall biosynthesis